jgi:di/tricarboxylate transporter
VLARRAPIPPSRLMMPLSFAAIVGGTMTIIGTTPNLILAEDVRMRLGPDEGLSMLDFAKVGAPVTALCILYMAFLGRRWLPAQSEEDRIRRAQLPDELAQAYGLNANLHRMRVTAESTIAGQSLREANLDGRWQLKVVVLRRPRGSRLRTLHPRVDLVFEPGDELYVEGRAEDAWAFSEDAWVQYGMADDGSMERLIEQGVTLAEVTLPPRSPALGQTIRDLRFRNEFDLSVMAIWRRNEIISVGLADTALVLGDAFLVAGSGADIRKLGRDPRFIVLSEGVQGEDVRRAPLAIGLLLLALLPPLLGWLPLAVSALASAILMRATRCVSRAGIRESMDFRILFLIAGTIPLGIALEQHGVAAGMADVILGVQPLLGTAGVIAALFVIAAVLSTTSNNSAAAVILAPVAYQVALGSPLSIEKSFLAVAFGTSCAYVLPFAHQCNLMVMGAGGYRTRDFVKVGLGMSLVMAAGTIVMLQLV